MELPNVNWSVSAVQLDGPLWKVSVNGQIAPGYHIYDTAEYGTSVNSTIITVDGGGNAHCYGPLKTLSTVDYHLDEVLGIEIGTISNEARFEQEVMLDKAGADLEVNVEWMACTEHECTPLDDTTITIHIGQQEIKENSAAYTAGVFCGVGTAIAVTLFSAWLALKKKKKA